MRWGKLASYFIWRLKVISSFCCCLRDSWPQDGATLYTAVRRKGGKSSTNGGQGVGKGMLGGPCHCWDHNLCMCSDLQPEESFLAAWAPSQVLIWTGGLAMLQPRITAAAVWEIGICECLWGEVVEKQAQLPQTGLAAVKLLGNVLQMKNREIPVYLKRLTNRCTHEWFLSQSFSSRDTRESSSFKTQQKILAKGRPFFSLW